MSLAGDIFRTIRYANLATASSDGEPWSAAVFYAYDKAFNLYWFSDVEAKHSKNIEARSQLAITIYDSTVAEGLGKGLQIEAVAERLEDLREIEKAVRIYNKFARMYRLSVDDVSGDSPTRMYRAEIRKVWTNIDSERNGKYIDAREEVVL